MRFYAGSKFPEEYRGAIFIAEHGLGTATRSRAIASRWSS
jgi:glucose/arabinose dehydrogenase